MKVSAYSVAQINKYVKNLLAEDVLLQGFFVKGEISNYKKHSSGHIYFTLKDEEASINSVIFKTYLGNIKSNIYDGLKVIAYGAVSVYEKTGQMQFYIEFIEPIGIGMLNNKLELLKKQLSDEGLFSITHKRALPPFPTSIAIVTSPSGAAVMDIIKVALRRNNAVQLYVYPVIVQGSEAPESIAKAIKHIDSLKLVDVIIIGRGGGSFEDLSAFNEEIVARAVYDCDTPIVSAVGHETDVTLSDFVADLRAATPSVAAEIVIPEKTTLENNIMAKVNLLNATISSKINTLTNNLDYSVACIEIINPHNLILYKKELLDKSVSEMTKTVNLIISNYWSLLSSQAKLLNSVNPLSVLERGFVSVTDENGFSVTSVVDVTENQKLYLQLKDGTISAVALEVFHGKEKN